MPLDAIIIILGNTSVSNSGPFLSVTLNRCLLCLALHFRRSCNLLPNQGCLLRTAIIFPGDIIPTIKCPSPGDPMIRRFCPSNASMQICFQQQSIPGGDDDIIPLLTSDSTACRLSKIGAIIPPFSFLNSSTAVFRMPVRSYTIRTPVLKTVRRISRKYPRSSRLMMPKRFPRSSTPLEFHMS